MLESRQRPTRINIDLQGYKKPWLAWCKAHKTTPSEAFRQIAAKLLAQGVPDEAGTFPETDNDDGKVRKEIRLTTSEAEQAEALAFKEGFSLPRWIVSLVRARLTGAPQFGQQELELLGRSNLQLLSIGRNLNQIARALNTSPEDRRAYQVEAIEQLQEAIKEHTKVVSAVMLANVERWRVK